MSNVFDRDSTHRPPQDSQSRLLQAFAVHLRARGHRDSTIHLYQKSVRHFLRWLDEQHERPREVNVQTVCAFLDEHLPGCACPSPAPRHLNSVRAALNQLLLLHDQDRLHTAVTPASKEIEATIVRFDTYLRDVCGLATSTRHKRYYLAREFLVSVFGGQSVAYEQITPQVLVQYVTKQARHYRAGTVGALACALRSFLRFLQFEGIPTASLQGAIPVPANWSLATLPPCLDEAELARFWDVFDRATAIGKRDYAMARCLADLGLRCQEVANLRLEAIDWRAGIVHLPRTKSQRSDRLPLPASTGQALVDYLRRGRPATASRAVFVYHRAPLGEAVVKTTVRGVVRRAFSRAGLPWSGTHVLRHTAATRMLQAGRTLKEIADVLRHRSIDTTVIYTKVDLPQLAAVALPWPERRP